MIEDEIKELTKEKPVWEIAQLPKPPPDSLTIKFIRSLINWRKK